MILIPCKDCITKPICRNEMIKMTLKHHTIYKHKNGPIELSINFDIVNYFLYQKCSLLKDLWERQLPSDLFYRLTYEFKITRSQLENEFKCKNIDFKYSNICINPYLS